MPYLRNTQTLEVVFTEDSQSPHYRELKALLDSSGHRPLWEEVSAEQAGVAAGADPAGSGGSGSPVVRAFPFAFDTPGLLTGHTVYTPTPNEILLDGWVEIDTAWDGTTPLGDFGTFVGNYGFLGNTIGFPIDMTLADATLEGVPQGLLANTNRMPGNDGNGPGGGSVPLTQAGVAGEGLTTGQQLVGYRAAPGRLLTADPIKVCVSQDGKRTGLDPGSTQGVGVLYLITAAPI